MRFRVALGLAQRYMLQPDPQNLLDFGAGDGHFAVMLRRTFPTAVVDAFDPTPSMHSLLSEKSNTDSGISPVARVENLRREYDAIFCLEVLEHLQDESILRAVDVWRAHLKPNGVIIVSVPIETGMGGLLKNIIRFFISESHAYRRTVKDIIKSTLGMEVKRSDEAYINSHFGFSHARLKRLLKENGAIFHKSQYSPIPWAGRNNSQCFWVLTLNHTQR